jgi:hypothetical protein
LKFIHHKKQDQTEALDEQVSQEHEAEEAIEREVYQQASEVSIEEDNSILSNTSSSVPDLPPWSQLDPSSLLAMPEKMRKQVLQAYDNITTTKNKAKKVIAKSPSRLPNRSITKPLSKTPRSRSIFKDNGNKATITQLFPPVSSPSSRTYASSTSASPSQSVDVSPSNSHSQFRPALEFEEEEELPFDADVWNELPKGNIATIW